MAVLWLKDVDADDVGTVGGKAASLGELIGAGLPVPPGFTVTAGTYRTFIEEAEIDEELFAAVDVDPEDSVALREAEETAAELILETPLPDDVREEIVERYRTMGDGDDEAFVAVRSSATAEDLPDSSFCRPAGDLPQRSRAGPDPTGERVLGVAFHPARDLLPAATGVPARRCRHRGRGPADG